MPKHLKGDTSRLTDDLTHLKPRKERRKTLVLEEIIKNKNFGGIKFIRRKVNKEARKQIDIIVNNINTKDDLKPDTAGKAISTLISLYLIDFEVYTDDAGRLRIKKWFPIKEDTYEDRNSP
jgi:hypothetical protein